VAEFLACEGPVIFDAVCEKDDHVYPMVPAGKALDEMVFMPSQTKK
jgi:acetolactate synthase-1/2/3 large subunit